jgi:methylenetetrahydrofolate dehydrogenase (NADP+)/methenyltetrahydrofolate cyclohydrolase
MSAIIFNGKTTAVEIERILVERLGVFPKTLPKLVSIYNSNHPPSALFTRLKQAAADRVGIPFQAVPISTDQQYVPDLISRFNTTDQVGGFLLQLPLTGQKRTDRRLCNLIDPAKDVDGLTAVNLTGLEQGNALILPAAVRAILEILVRVPQSVYPLPGGSKIFTDSLLEHWRARLPWLADKSVTVIGARGMVGKPLTDLFRQLAGTTLEAEVNTTNLVNLTRKGDIIVSAIGRPGFIEPKMVKPGAMVIDIGTTVVNGKATGDIDPAVADIASFFTPVPGGVGPMTVVSLLENFLDLVGVPCLDT